MRPSWKPWSSAYALGAVAVALMGLLGYVPGLGLLGSIKEGYIPMAPSTAISFVLIGGMLLFLDTKRLSRLQAIALSMIAALVSLFAALDVIGAIVGRDLNLEDAIVPAAGQLDGIPVARMSPATGALFFLAGILVLAFILERRLTQHSKPVEYVTFALSMSLLVASFIFFLAYLYNMPLFYGMNTTIPMAMTTSIGFVLVALSSLDLQRDTFHLRLINGNTTRSFLLRYILPLSVSSVVLGGMAALSSTRVFGVNPAILSAGLTLAVVAITGLVAALMSRHMGSVIDKQSEAIERASQALSESEAQYRDLYETMTQGVAYQDANGEITSANPAAEEILGLSLDQMQGRTSLDPRWRAVDQHMRDLPGEEHPAMVALRTGKPVRNFVLGVFNPRLDRHVWCLVNSIPQYRESSDKPYQVHSTFLDVTARLQAEKALAANYSLLDMAGSLARFGGWSVDLATNTITWSDMVADIHQMPRGHAPSVEEGVRFYAPEWRDKIAEVFTACAEQGTPYDEEMEILTANGNRVWVRTLGQAVRDDRGQIVRIEGAFQDISERKAAQEALRRSQELQRAMVSASPLAIFSLDPQGHVLTWNAAAEKILGWTEEEVLGMVLPHVPSEELDASHSLMDRVLAGESLFDLELRRQHKDGSPIELRLSAAPIRDSQDQVAAVIAVLEDIIQRRQAERALQQSEEKYRLLAETTQDIILLHDMEGRVTYVNQAGIELIGLTYAEVLAKSIAAFVPSEELAAAMSRQEQRANGDDSIYHYESVFISQDGQRTPVEVNSSPVVREGKPTEILIVARDISSRKQAEDALTSSLNRWQNTFDAISDIVCVVSTDHECLAINKTGLESVGLAREEIIGRKCYEVLHDAQGPIAQCPCAVMLESGKPETSEVEQDGRHLLLQVWPITNPNGDITSFVHIIKDITEQKQAEEEREKLQAQLIQSQKIESVGRLAGGVAHDFNNMLSVILGYAEFALEKVTRQDAIHDDLTEIVKAGQRSAEITHQLLAFARKQTAAPQMLDLNEAVESMLKMLRRLIGEDINLVWQPGSGTLSAYMDPSQLDQILANLCVNARDAISGVGRISIETERVTLDKAYCAIHADSVPGDYVLLAVGDDGCGMDQDTLEHIFEPFFTTKEVGQGTGLGLATVYGIVRQNEGFVNVYSEPDVGTTFRIYLPYHAGLADQSSAPEAGETPLGHGETVLVVEDDAAILRFAKTVLENLGYVVLSATAPGQALALIRHETGKIDLLLTDVVMPDMNGRDLSQQLTALYPDLKVVFMSGYTADIISHRGVLESGMAFIQKPFAVGTLARIVREALDQA